MTAAKLRLKPAVAGSIVRDPDTGRHLAPEGSSVPNNPYWRRRLRDGSAVKAGPAPKDEPKPDAKKS